MIVNIAGVPEHFNLPWRLVVSGQDDVSVAYKWTDFPGGTGDMCKALRTGEADIAILLTEGILKDISQGNPAEIIDVYISSPLVWGIHVNAASTFTKVSQLQNKNAAISRFGSGSHLMVKVLASSQEWTEEEVSFVTVGDITGGIHALEKGDADYFLWEKFTLKPWVDHGILRRIGECLTPWPCFVIAVAKHSWEEKREKIEKLIRLAKEKAEWVKTSTEAISVLADKYHLQRDDIIAWRKQTEWFGVPWSKELEQQIRLQLRQYGII